MAKKTHIDKSNPAYQFISIEAEEPLSEEIQNGEEQIASLKSTTKGVPEGYKLNPLYIEKKSKRLQLVVQPSLYEKVKAAAIASETSVNDYIHTVLEAAVKEGK